MARADLQTLLESFCPNVYFQPPSNIRMQYPCIVYRRNSNWVEYANNRPIHRMVQYEVTVIDRDPESPIPRSIAELQYSRFSRHFVADDLNHDVYTLYWKGQ